MTDFKHDKKRAVTLAALGLAGIILIFTLKPGAGKTAVFRQSGIVWNTEYHITYTGTADMADSVTAVFRKVELSVSPFNKASLITAVNENRTDSLDRALLALYTASKRISGESGGAFDPTVSPLVNAWGFGFKDGGTPPAPATVDSLLRIVGIAKTAVKGNRLIKPDDRMTFNFSAIAKGFGCDEIGRMFRRNGITDYMVEVGGEIAVCGKNPQGKEWHISIDKPVMSGDTVFHDSAETIAATGCGIATSGNYRNYRTDSSGNRYAHIVDPATGYPVKSDVLSATVVAPDCMTADAYATAFMVLGLEKSKELLEKHPELAAMLITADTKGGLLIWHSPSYKKHLTAPDNSGIPRLVL